MQFRMRGMATLALALALLLGLAPGCGSASEDPIASPIGAIARSVIATDTTHHAIGGRVAAASFRETIDASTITRTTFAVPGPDGTSVCGGCAR